MNTSKLSDPIPVRFHESTLQLIDEASRKFQLSRSHVIRLALDQKLKEWNANGEMILKTTSK
jgi:metal-responsive CopG/Arc/MetJ family transcriptional regulator